MRQTPEALLDELLVAHQDFFQTYDSILSVRDFVFCRYAALLSALPGMLPEAVCAKFPMRTLFALGRECLNRIVSWASSPHSPTVVIGLLAQFGKYEELFAAAAPRISASIAESVRWTEMPQLGSLCDERVALLALAAASDFRELPALIQHVEERTDPDSGLLKPDTVVLLSLFALAVVLTLPLLRKHLAKASAEFQKLASRYADRAWAEKLLCQGVRYSWRVSQAWQTAGLSEAEKAEAVAALSDLMADLQFTLIQPESGAIYDERKMKLANETGGSLPRRYVWKMQRAGLQQASTVIECALVEAGSAERMALWRTHDLTATRRYFDKYRSKYPAQPDPDRDHQLDGACLNDVVNSLSDEEVDAWLRALVRQAPRGALYFVIDEPDVPFLDAEMIPSGNLNSQTATVQKIIYPGLRRSDGTLLLRARVEVHTDQDF